MSIEEFQLLDKETFGNSIIKRNFTEYTINKELN